MSNVDVSCLFIRGKKVVLSVKLTTIVSGVILTLLSTHAINALASNINIDPEVEACIRKNAPKSTAVEKIRLTSEGSMYQEQQVLSAKVYWKHYPAGTSNILTLFDEPDDILGSPGKASRKRNLSVYASIIQGAAYFFR